MLNMVTITNPTDAAVKIFDGPTDISVPAKTTVVVPVSYYCQMVASLGKNAVGDNKLRLDGVAVSQAGRTEELDVRRFGATGDAKSDDNDAIQRACDYAYEVGGGMVYVPSGVYDCGGVVVRDKVGIKGDGVASVLDGSLSFVGADGNYAICSLDHVCVGGGHE